MDYTSTEHSYLENMPALENQTYQIVAGRTLKGQKGTLETPYILRRQKAPQVLTWLKNNF